MIDNPQTVQEAQAYRYNRWAGNPKGWCYLPQRCAYEVWTRTLPYQCRRPNGHGPAKLYCKQHAKKVKR